jgi:hypothetical protein
VVFTRIVKDGSSLPRIAKSFCGCLHVSSTCKDSFIKEFFGVDGLGDQGDQHVIIIQQSPPAPTAKPSEPAENRIYVQPRWVDGGYGVQVLEPGYWTVPKQAAER